MPSVVPFLPRPSQKENLSNIPSSSIFKSDPRTFQPRRGEVRQGGESSQGKYVSKQAIPEGSWDILLGNWVFGIELRHLSYSRGRELGYLYTNLHQSLCEECSWETLTPWHSSLLGPGRVNCGTQRKPQAKRQRGWQLKGPGRVKVRRQEWGPWSTCYKLKTKPLKISHLVGLSPTPLMNTRIITRLTINSGPGYLHLENVL